MRSSTRDVLQTLIGTVMAIAVLFASFGAPLAAQFNRVEADPNMPVKDGFDTDVALLWTQPNFIPLRNPEWQSLRAARRAGEVSDETTVVTFDVQGKTLALVSGQMAYHHVAQGSVATEPWMVSF